MNKQLEEAMKHLEDVKENIKPISNSFDLLTESSIEIVLKELERLQEENAELKLKERNRHLGRYGEIEIHDLINKTLQEDYIPKDKIREKMVKAANKLEELGDLQIYNYEKYIQTETQAKIFCLEQIIKDYKELLEGK